MPRTRPVGLAALGLAMLLAAGVAGAQPFVDDGNRTPAERRLQQRLGLSEEQMMAVHEIHQRELDALRPLRTSFRDAHDELQRLALDGGDDAAIRAKIVQLQSLLGQILALQTRTLADLSHVLTPEQRDRFPTIGAEVGGVAPGGGVP